MIRNKIFETLLELELVVCDFISNLSVYSIKSVCGYNYNVLDWKWHKNHTGKKDTPLIVQFDEQRENVHKTIERILNSSKFGINNERVTVIKRDLKLNLNKKSDKTIIGSQNAKIGNVPIVKIDIFKFGKSNHIKKPDLTQIKYESNENVNTSTTRVIKVVLADLINKPKNQCNQPRIRKLLNNDLGKFKS